MTEKSKPLDRREAAEYWDTHSVDEVESEEVEIEVKKPLSAVLTVRLDPDHLKKLKLLARAQGIGVTTMARHILEQALERPGSQLVLQALQDAGVKRAVSSVLAQSQIPPDTEEPVYYILSRESLEHIGRMVYDTAHQLLMEGIREKAAAVTEKQGELYDRVREMAEAKI